MNDKQRAFAREYAVDHNPKRAAIKVGYSAKTAEVQASRLLRIVKVRALIDELDAKHAKATDTDSKRCREELAKLAFCSPDELEMWPSGRLSDKLHAIVKLLELNGDLGPLAARRGADVDGIPGVIVVPSQMSMKEWEEAFGVVELDKDGNEIKAN